MTMHWKLLSLSQNWIIYRKELFIFALNWLGQLRTFGERNLEFKKFWQNPCRKGWHYVALLQVIPSKKDTRRNNDSGVFTTRSQQPTTDVSYWQEAMPYKTIA